MSMEDTNIWVNYKKFVLTHRNVCRRTIRTIIKKSYFSVWLKFYSLNQYYEDKPWAPKDLILEHEYWPAFDTNLVGIAPVLVNISKLGATEPLTQPSWIIQRCQNLKRIFNINAYLKFLKNSETSRSF